MTARGWTLIFIAVVSVAIAVWDTIRAANRIPGDTISEITLAWTRAHPIAFVLFILWIGILIGHLVCPQYVPQVTK